MKAVFLDRDGVINPLVFYHDKDILDSPFSPAQFKLMPEAADAIRKLNRNGFKVIVVSNQPAIAKKKMTLDSLKRIDEKLHRLLKKEMASVDDVMYCLHHPSEGNGKYRKRCSCRKPKPGLILEAAKKHKIDLSHSFIIGDSLTDIQAGRAAGLVTFLIGKLKCDLCKFIDEKNCWPDFIVTDLMSAVNIIIKKKGRENEYIY